MEGGYLQCLRMIYFKYHPQTSSFEWASANLNSHCKYPPKIAYFMLFSPLKWGILALKWVPTPNPTRLGFGVTHFRLMRTRDPIWNGYLRCAKRTPQNPWPKISLDLGYLGPIFYGGGQWVWGMIFAKYHPLTRARARAKCEYIFALYQNTPLNAIFLVFCTKKCVKVGINWRRCGGSPK